MLMPSLFTNSFMDDFFDAPSFGVYKYDAPAQNLMSTDVFEKEDGYEIDMNPPGFKKVPATDPSMWAMRSHRMISRQNSKMVS